MARVKRPNPNPRRRNTESRPNTNTEAEEKEEAQTEPEASEKKNSPGGSGGISSDEEGKAQSEKQAIAKGKRTMKAKEGKQKWDFSEMTGMKRNKGVVTGEAKKSETVTTPVSTRKVATYGRAVRRGNKKVRLFAVRSSFSLSSQVKGLDVNVASDDKEPKGKGKEEETDDFQDLEADSEKVCKRLKKERESDDDSDDNDGGGNGAGAQKNLSTLALSEGLIAGN